MPLSPPGPPVVGGQGGDFILEEDIYYGLGPRNIGPPQEERFLDVYRPRPFKLPPFGPVILYLHGFGDVNSDQKIGDIHTFGDFLNRGITLVSADYGGWHKDVKTETTLFPDPQRHIVECVAWIHANADKYGWDASKLGIMGRSFGGMLGSCVTYGEEMDFGLPSALRPAAFISVDGMLDWDALKRDENFNIVQHFNYKVKRPDGVLKQKNLGNASGLQILIDWPITLPERGIWSPPPPAYAWAALRVGQKYGEITDPHDPYFGRELVEILRETFGVKESKFRSGGKITDFTPEMAEWFLDVVK